MAADLVVLWHTTAFRASTWIRTGISHVFDYILHSHRYAAGIHLFFPFQEHFTSIYFQYFFSGDYEIFRNNFNYWMTFAIGIIFVPVILIYFTRAVSSTPESLW